MISGRIANLEAVVELEVAGPTGKSRRVQAVIDTGCNAFFTLSLVLIEELELPFAGHRRGMLADGRTAVLDAYLGAVSWHGHQRDVLILGTAGSPLIGMALLAGSRLTADIIEDGTVTIDKLP